MMQSIMWVVLGASIGTAALIDRHKSSTIDARLGAPRTLPHDIKVKLPEGWEETEEASGDVLASLEDPEYARGIKIELHSRSWDDVRNLFSNARQIAPLGSIPIGDDEGTLTYKRDRTEIDTYSEFTARRNLAGGKSLIITLTIDGYFRKQSELNREQKLIEQIAASVEIPESLKRTPATQP